MEWNGAGVHRDTHAAWVCVCVCVCARVCSVATVLDANANLVRALVTAGGSGLVAAAKLLL